MEIVVGNPMMMPVADEITSSGYRCSDIPCPTYERLGENLKVNPQRILHRFSTAGLPPSPTCCETSTEYCPDEIEDWHGEDDREKKIGKLFTAHQPRDDLDRYFAIHTVMAALAVKLQPNTHHPTLPICSCVSGSSYIVGSTTLNGSSPAVIPDKEFRKESIDRERLVSAEAALGIA